MEENKGYSKQYEQIKYLFFKKDKFLKNRQRYGKNKQKKVTNE